ncbi:MAG: UDP-glucose/GDP-mannose dehydrogenase family protein, partial [Candidatus Aenigmarchaeota archaeon]|nr:UDP-glucose/GDP-mannose dehydrogenase family protein [Candidatus Aenigmarchaeota archaeon]
VPILMTGLTVAEMIKYTSNAFLAAKVSLSNEIGNICKALGIDTYEVMKGVGYDKRIGSHFLNAGCGFGGSCFPKDVKALVAKARELGYEPQMLNEVLELNERQKTLNLKLLGKKMQVRGKKVAVLGLAFKPGTDDTRESPALAVIPELQKLGANVVVYDPMTHVRNQFPDVEHASSVEEALRGSHACLIMTDWPQFKELDDRHFDAMDNKVIIEGRKTLNPIKVTDFEGVCW